MAIRSRENGATIRALDVAFIDQRPASQDIAEAFDF